MRLITLNCWGGRSMHPLMRFFRARKAETDVFCLQEVFDADQSVVDARHPDEHMRADLYARIAAELDGFWGTFARWTDPNRMSTAIFVRETIPVLALAAPTVYEPPAPKSEGSLVFSPRKLHAVTLDLGRPVMVGNLHGLWNAGPKTDTPERLAQSRKVAAVLNAHAGPKVLCGDFNLLPETESVRVLEEEAGLRNLVVERGVPSTRTPLYRHYADAAEPNFADYVMPSRDLEVKRFEVLPDLVSDHSPLYAEFA